MALTSVPPESRTTQPLRIERLGLDDSVIMKTIQATHAPDGREIDVKPLLHVIEDIFSRTTPALIHDTQEHIDMEKTNLQVGSIGMLEALKFTLQRISNECTGGGDAHATTVALFNTLSSYTWDAKMVLALSAFAVNYGEFSLVAQLHTTNPLAKSVAVLQQLPAILEHSDALKPKFDAFTNLIHEMLKVTKCVVQFRDLPKEKISPDTPAMAAAMTHIPTAVYWTIRSIVACSSLIIGLTGFGHEIMTSTTEVRELSTLAHKVRNIHDHLRKQLTLCHQYIEERNQAFNTLVRLFETPDIDNMKVLKALIYPKDDQQPLLDGFNKRRVHIEVLWRKNVLLLISDLDISHDELVVLEQMYRESREHSTWPQSQYEVVWLPIADRLVPWDDARNQRFEQLQSTMPWYSVYHPSLLDPAAIRYMKEVWHFEKKPILVVLDPLGTVVSPNALHMMRIWGNQAFPFTPTREEALWSEEKWRLELLVDGIDPNILHWITEDRIICLYGGEDMDWIRNFTTTAQAVAKAAGLPLEMVYVGKSNPKERVRKNITTITVENLSHCWPDLRSIWFFWERLESMWYSKMQHGKTVENDVIMKEIMTMLSFDGSDQGWAVISQGSSQMAKAKGDTMLLCLTQHDMWKENISQQGFVPSMNTHLHRLHTPDPHIMYRCCYIILLLLPLLLLLRVFYR